MAINTPFNAAAAAYGNASRLINQAAKPVSPPWPSPERQI